MESCPRRPCTARRESPGAAGARVDLNGKIRTRETAAGPPTYAGRTSACGSGRVTEILRTLYCVRPWRPPFQIVALLATRTTVRQVCQKVVFDHRTYHLFPGKLPPFQCHFRLCSSID